MVVPPYGRPAILLLPFLLTFGPLESASAQRQSSLTTFRDLLRTLSTAPADACNSDQDSHSLENQLFTAADNLVSQALNEQPDNHDPRSRAVKALESLESLSANSNKNWPNEKRFHFEIRELPPALFVKMTYRNRATFSFFAMPPHGPTAWRAIGIDDQRYKSEVVYESLDLFPLQRGPAKNPRFLAKFEIDGCGSGMEVSYHAYEWNPGEPENLMELIKLEGSLTQNDAIRSDSQKTRQDSFPPVGVFHADGTVITLPYCWFSAIDTWDNPSLCAVNSYDLSHDHVRFVGSRVNRPDMLPIAKVIEHAQAHDYPAVLAYCGSSRVARKIFRNVPPFVFGSGGLIIKQINGSKKRVEIGDQQTFQFDVENREGRWLVVSFQID